MNFENIEKLSDDELLQLFENEIIEDNDYYSHCFCDSSYSYYLGYNFGYDRSPMGCAHKLITLQDCSNACYKFFGHGPGYLFDSACFCSKYNSYKTWTDCL